LALNAPVGCEPLAALAPDQAPEAVHAVAWFDDHTRVDPLPLATVLGLAESARVGAGWVTETVVDWLALVPAPVQVSVYVAFAVSAPVLCIPFRASAPDQAPEAVQAVALVDDQESIAALPLATVLGLALNVTVAAGRGLTLIVVDWTAEPPAPVQVST
jgi:hypothetical protein